MLRLFSAFAPETMIPTHDSYISHDLSGYSGAHLESSKSLRPQHIAALKQLQKAGRSVVRLWSNGGALESFQ